MKLTFARHIILHKLHSVGTNALVASFSIHACTVRTRFPLTFIDVWRKKNSLSSALHSANELHRSARRQNFESNISILKALSRNKKCLSLEITFKGARRRQKNVWIYACYIQHWRPIYYVPDQWPDFPVQLTTTHKSLGDSRGPEKLRKTNGWQTLQFWGSPELHC